MRALVQRAREASVSVDGRVVGAIGAGLVVLAGVGTGDGDDDREWLVRKIVALRIFDDDAGVMNRSVIETGGDILAVSQFTLFASTKKGARPSWSAAAPPGDRRAGVLEVRRRARRGHRQAHRDGRFRRRDAGRARQ